MDNFRFVILSLLIICLLGFADTNYVNKKVAEHKLIKHYSNKTKIIGFGIEESGNYIKVKEVIENTPAERAGILTKDVIVSLNYRDISSAEKFLETLSYASDNQKLILGVLRAGENHILYISLCPECLPKLK